MHELGELYRFGANGVEQNTELATSWCQRAAEAGDVAAMKAVAILFYNMARDLFYANEDDDQAIYMAIHWYQKAASAGDVEAMIALGKILENESREFEHGEEYLQSAIRWYQKAADAGSQSARRKLVSIRHLLIKREASAVRYAVAQDCQPSEMDWESIPLLSRDSSHKVLVNFEEEYAENVYEVTQSLLAAIRWEERLAEEGLEPTDQDYLAYALADLAKR